MKPDDPAPPTVIVIVAAIIEDEDGRLLLVRKRGTDRFMQPGGKIDPGETAAEALIRELREELTLVVTPADLVYLGRFDAPAANEAGHVVDAEIFFVTAGGQAVASAEIEELIWMSPADAASVALAPLTVDVLMPVLAAR
ncbi:8-oxo-dGTP pyrophosphatase MutT (NUDIX family) [Conyzicola lurida]|uniref:8-oxo-dGTP pyrophosphatase MutT (NUDIX family) n=1 Tax=Conyzicola lurida TaxID=1172621 RepID=A0A841ALT6_9MICO|nr:8-oxo-dGTP pyrophosphatase MutT (NUDIX family) [Conyzicola lurida]